MKKPIQALLIPGMIFCFAHSVVAQHQLYQEKKGAQVSEARLLGLSTPLKDVSSFISNQNLKEKKTKPFYSNTKRYFQNDIAIPTPFAEDALPKDGDPIRQLGMDKLTSSIEPQLILEGIHANSSNASVPDPNGDVSSEHYIQMTNSESGAIFTIWDKITGELLQDVTSLNALWQQFTAEGIGDGIVLFDHQADRWMLSELGNVGNGAPAMLIAISQTNDPFGAYFVYEFTTQYLPDFPKFGIWPNAILITANEAFETEVPVYALDRQAMLSGEPIVDVQRILALPKFNTTDDLFNFQVATPADWDGDNPPPTDSYNYVVRIYEDAWEGGVDALEIWGFIINWDNPNSTQVAGPLVLPTAAFDSDLCGTNIFTCITHTGSTESLAAQQQIVMNRVQYRNFGTHESIVLNHSVDVGDNIAGIRWYELRKQNGNNWEIYQQGTFAPDDQSRFLASMAMDGSGNILLGYSVTSADKDLSLRFTGRRADDPLHEMTIDEFEFAPGEDVYYGTRWGDYANMCVDPDDDRTFWFTSEYMRLGKWGTKIMNAVVQRDSNNIGTFALINPVNSTLLTDAETVKVLIKNEGHLPAENFNISYQFENGSIVTEVVSDTIIQPDSVYTHTFVPTVDLSALGDYDFTIFTSMIADSTFSNDTLRSNIKKLTRFDAGISNIQGLEAPLCETNFVAHAILTNYGQENLTTVDIIFKINGGADMTINWAGNLPFGETEMILLESTQLLSAANTVSVYTENPNEVADEDPTNDAFLREFEHAGENGKLRFELLTDDYPAETSWALFDSNSDLIYAGGGYPQAQTLYIENWCVIEGCYTYEIYDTFGDGIAHQGVEGHYKIIRESDEAVLIQLINPDFGKFEINPFCKESSGCVLTTAFTVTNTNMPGGNDGSILMMPSGGIPPYEYTIDDGYSWSGSALLDNLPEGVYEVIIRDQQDCTTQVTVVIEACLLEISAAVLDASSSNSNDGTISINTNNGTPPFIYSLDGIYYQDLNVFENLGIGEYTVLVEDSTGCARDLILNIGSFVGTGNNFFGYDLQVYPNPTSDEIQIELKGLPEVSTLWFQVFDATGRQVKTGRLVSYSGILFGQVSFQELATGNYFLHFDHTPFNRMIKIQKVD